MSESMLIFKAGELSPEQVWQLVDSTQRFFVSGLGMDREVVSDAMVKRIFSSSDPSSELDYYARVLEDVKRVLASREG